MLEQDDAYSAAEQAARTSYGRLLALLASRTGDLADAEDALAEAFAAALASWPRRGVPRNPDAWLLVAARRRLIDQARRRSLEVEGAPELAGAAQVIAEWDDGVPFPDERLKLLFIAAHPAIDTAARAPLMLQTVLGLSADQMAGAFLVPPKTLGQRLWRAKQRIREARIPFEVPHAAELPQRVDSVLEAIYGLYGLGWDAIAGGEPGGRDLANEAVWLARVAVELLPAEPEARGLLALLLYCESRRAARRTGGGAYVPLSEQDTTLWSRPLMAEAEHHLTCAAGLRCIGPLQLEAALQSAHASRAWTGRTDRQAIVALASALADLTQSVGARVAHAAALGEAEGPGRALTLLDGLSPADVVRYQPYWALRAHLLELAGHEAEGRACRERAAGLTEDAAVRAFLLERHR